MTSFCHIAIIYSLLALALSLLLIAQLSALILPNSQQSYILTYFSVIQEVPALLCASVLLIHPALASPPSNILAQNSEL